MVRGAITAPLYISVAWSLIVSYQLFTQTAVNSIIVALNTHWGSVGHLLAPRVDTIVFVHAFAWIFVLSSVIPVVILGRSRSVLLQFFLCLTLTFVATAVKDLLQLSVGSNSNLGLENFAVWFQNPVLAGFYLSIPYLFMLYLDIRTRRVNREQKDEDPATVDVSEAKAEEPEVETIEVEQIMVDAEEEEGVLYVEEIEGNESNSSC
jgi:hypothetical protein